jgi:hypothetical protein
MDRLVEDVAAEQLALDEAREEAVTLRRFPIALDEATEARIATRDASVKRVRARHFRFPRSTCDDYVSRADHFFCALLIVFCAVLYMVLLTSSKSIIIACLVPILTSPLAVTDVLNGMITSDSSSFSAGSHSRTCTLSGLSPACLARPFSYVRACVRACVRA